MNRRKPGMRTTAIAVGVLFGLTLWGGPAFAARPMFQNHVKFQDDLHEVAELTEGCGFAVFHEEKVNVVQRIYDDGTEQIRFSIHETLVNPDSGEVLEHHLAGSRTLQGTQTADGDELTIDGSVRHAGLPSHWRKPGEGVLLRDAGLADLDVHVVLDISQDPPELISQEIEVIGVHGPHPELEMSAEEFLEFVCGALT